MKLPETGPAEDKEMLDTLARETFTYFLRHSNEKTGLIADKSQPGSAASISVVGLAFSCYIVAVENGWINRDDAAGRIRKVLQFLSRSQQGTGQDMTGHKGFYYHFLDMETGKRVNNCELSTVDSAFFIAGALSAKTYFSAEDPVEQEIGVLADALYRRIDWHWACNGAATLTHGWKPRMGFLKYRWDQDYSEALLMYVLALGSPTYPVAPSGYKQWTSTFRKETLYGVDQLYAGPLFIHQLSQVWIDCRKINDDFNRKIGFDYFENSRRATYMQRQYAIENPKKFAGYGPDCWGITASDGPGPGRRQVKGRRHTFYDYKARGAPHGPDDGTVAPWAVVASLPFAPEIVIGTIRASIERYELKGPDREGFDASFNPSFPDKNRNRHGWVSEWKYGLNQGPVILMIANFQSGLLWKLTSKCNYLREGLRHAGFTGGWLDDL